VIWTFSITLASMAGSDCMRMQPGLGAKKFYDLFVSSVTLSIVKFVVAISINPL